MFKAALALSLILTCAQTSASVGLARVKLFTDVLKTNWDVEDGLVSAVQFKREKQPRDHVGGSFLVFSALEITVTNPTGQKTTYSLPADTAARHGLSFMDISKILRKPDAKISLSLNNRPEIIDFAFHDDCQLDLMYDLTNW